MLFLVQVYYTHPGFRTSIFGKNRAYCIRDFTVYTGPNCPQNLPTVPKIVKTQMTWAESGLIPRWLHRFILINIDSAISNVVKQMQLKASVSLSCESDSIHNYTRL